MSYGLVIVDGLIHERTCLKVGLSGCCSRTIIQKDVSYGRVVVDGLFHERTCRVVVDGLLHEMACLTV